MTPEESANVAASLRDIAENHPEALLRAGQSREDVATLAGEFDQP